MNKKLKIILCIAIVILIALISFGGVYIKDTVIFKNKIPDYLLASEFGDKRITSFKINTETKEVIRDKDGKEVTSIPEGANEADYTKENVKVNSDESLTSENYRKVKEIFDGRLKELGVNDYKVRLDEKEGNIVVELEDNLKTDEFLQDLLCKGDFSITDAKEGNILLDKSDLKKANVLYSNTGSGVRVFLEIAFNKEGEEKLQEISKKYVKPSEEVEASDNTNKVTLKIEGTDMMSTYFDEEITNGKLTISLGITQNEETLQTYVEQGKFYAMLLNNDEMPVEYTIGISEISKGNLSGTEMKIIICVAALISAAIMIYLIIRFKLDGICAVISIISWVSLLLVILRYTGTAISLNAICGIVLLIILDSYIICKMLKAIKEDSSYENVNKEVIRVYAKEKEVIIVTLIAAVVFTFMQYVQSYSFGMTLFYGIISIAISNLLLLRTMILARYSNN